ncbi:signal peptidase II [Streptomyces chromofuscus]|uniref:Lipoprotein signal peptidase n=1 Tax=Streptomyces chromofuscus TaxID=42881 RepID=A0A7M2TD40_STRCW|nr:signal peptidase II [Streptomyces chromofuscus]QOV46154.1 signal peptidase II [Streptomyces chromofuscus]GGS96902.1 lipoprotein signal peptidase [Streptomyces chromofuscus]
MAEAERIIGTPGTPEAARAGQERPGDDAVSQERSGAEAAQTPAGGSGGDEPAGEAAAGSSGTDGRDAEVGRPRGRRRIAVLFAVAGVAYALDLISKMIVVAKLEHHEPIEVIGDWLRFEAIRNAGAAFGFGEAFTVIFTVIAAVVIVVIARLARKLYSLPWAIALGLLLGGALGNLTDRVFRSPGVFKGAVVDFIAPKHFAVFNLADSAIVCGGILIVLLSFKGLDPDGTVHKD